MVNGTISRILYIGALCIVALCVAGAVSLSFTGDGELPGDAKMALYTCLGFLFGTHVKPPISKAAGFVQRTLGDKEDAP